MHQWQIGDVEIFRIQDFDVALPSEHRLADWMVPTFGPTAGEYRVADSAIAIRDGETRIVVDPWLLSFRPGDDAVEHSGQLLRQLDDAGFAADQVDIVINSHLDGLGW